MSEQQYQVRVKPYNRKKGHLARIVMHRGKKYKGVLGWYSPIPEWIARELEDLRQTADEEKFMFDVVTMEEAQHIEAMEIAAAEVGTAKHAQPFNASGVRGAPPEPPPRPAPPDPEHHTAPPDDPAWPKEESVPEPKPELEVEAPKAEAKAKPSRPRRGGKAKK